MINKSEIYKKAATPAALALLVINLAFLCWYLFVGYQAGFHSDSAAKVLIAREIVATGDYFPNDWNYVNKDLFVLFGHTFIIPLLAFMPAGYTAHAISGLFSSALILSGIWFLTSMAPLSTARRLLVVAIVAAGISGFMAENLFGQVSYGTVVYFSCYIVYFSWRFIGAARSKKWLWGTALLVVFVLAFWSNPQRALVSYGIPLLVAILALYMWRLVLIPGNKRTSVWLPVGVVGISIAIGVFLHMQTIHGVNNVVEAGHARWLPYDLMVRNATQTFGWFIYIFGGLPSAENIVFSRAGIYDAWRLIAAMVLLVLMPLTIYRTLRQQKSGFIILGVFTLTQLITFTFLLITTTIPTMSDPFSGARYLVPSLVFILILVLGQPICLKSYPLSSISVAFVSLLFVSSAYLNFGGHDQNGNPRSALIEFLSAHNLQHGYGTYWNAGVISVSSNEKTLVRQVVVDSGIPMPMRHLSSNSWYRPSAWQGETFLLLTSQEAKAIDWDRLALYRVKPSRELTFANYKIYVFAENIARNLPGWDSRYEEPATFVASKYSLSQTGRFVEKFDQSDAALIAEKGQSGALHFGPYVNVEPGRYVVTFDVFARNNPAGVVRLDVAAAPDQKLFGEKLLLSSDRPQEIVFTLNEARTMEFRVLALGNEQVVFKGVTIRRIPDSVKSITDADMQ